MSEIEDAGFKDLFIGTELYKNLGVMPYEFSADPVKFGKLRTLAQFLNEHPDPKWAIERVRNNKTNMSNLDFLTSYALLNTKRSEIRKQLEGVEKDMKDYE